MRLSTPSQRHPRHPRSHVFATVLSYDHAPLAAPLRPWGEAYTPPSSRRASFSHLLTRTSPTLCSTCTHPSVHLPQPSEPSKIYLGEAVLMSIGPHSSLATFEMPFPPELCFSSAPCAVSAWTPTRSPSSLFSPQPLVSPAPSPALPLTFFCSN